MAKDTIEYDVLSPDGITISFDETYKTPEEAKEACLKWANRYEGQGYYRTNRMEKIPVDEIIEHCTLVELKNGIRIN